MTQNKGKAPRLQVVVSDAAEDPRAETAGTVAEDERAAEEMPAAEEAPATDQQTEDGANPIPTGAKKGTGAASWLSRTFPGHEHAAVGGLCGIVVAILVFAVGFWKALFVTLMAVVGVALGQCLDGNPKMVNFIRRVVDELRSE